uniref:PGG domain-containing protein n=1 Tax=Populus trichocarpa TaxID=3694 RepID=A0A3N7FRM6_POPTR
MGSLPISEIPYIAAMNGDWKSMIGYYQEHFEFLYSPVTLSLDTGFHLAVHSNAERPLKDLLEIMGVVEFLTETRNKFGNTVLHEATIYGNYEAVVLLVERCPDLISILNDFGETPLFTAAAFGEAKIVEYLIETRPEKCVDCNGRILSIHRQRSKDGRSILRQRSKDGLSILGAAIIGQHFETALLLLELDESLHDLEDKMGRTALQLLAEMPTGFESGYPMGICERLIYCLPVIRHHKVKSQVESWCRAMKDLESGTLGSNLLNFFKDPKESKMISNLLRCRFLPQGYWPARLERFWNQKRTNVFALGLVKILIQKDTSWKSVSITVEGEEAKQTGPPSSTVMQGDRNKGKEEENEFPYLGQTSEITSKAKEIEEVHHPTAQPSVTNSSLTSNEQISLFLATGNGIEEIVRGIIKQHPHAIKQLNVTNSPLTREEQIPLFLATRNGIEEIVWEIMKLYPHAVEKLNDKGQSILDVAVIHRQEKIFNLVKHQKIPLARLRRVIDNKGNTLLHHVADMEHYRGGTKPGPALKLQEELQWFEQVREVIPSHYVTLRNDEGKTAEELFKESHKDQLENAQKWIKETTQSCSTVAALVATVVFAAAYTVPGGSDEDGTPNFINSPYFLVFTVSDVLSLASSLTSLVVFLSLLTSPFELQEFHISLPRKLLVGFTFLFFAVITTMLSFGATILILIQSEKKLTTLLLSIAAFLPVLVFAIMQFRLYVSFMGSTYNILKITRKARTPFLEYLRKKLR